MPTVPELGKFCFWKRDNNPKTVLQDLGAANLWPNLASPSRHWPAFRSSYFRNLPATGAFVYKLSQSAFPSLFTYFSQLSLRANHQGSVPSPPLLWSKIPTFIDTQIKSYFICVIFITTAILHVSEFVSSSSLWPPKGQRRVYQVLATCFLWMISLQLPFKIGPSNVHFLHSGKLRPREAHPANSQVGDSSSHFLHSENPSPSPLCGGPRDRGPSPRWASAELGEGRATGRDHPRSSTQTGLPGSRSLGKVPAGGGKTLALA